jgi:hypothetical protein
MIQLPIAAAWETSKRDHWCVIFLYPFKLVNSQLNTGRSLVWSLRGDLSPPFISLESKA